MYRKDLVEFPRRVGAVLWIVVAIASLLLVNLSSVQAESPTPPPTCTDCELMATRAAGLSTAWSVQSKPDLVQSHAHSVVRVILFWMDSCGHCHYVLEEVLPPLQQKYGERLEILLIELKSMEDIDRLYVAAEALGIARDDVAVPFLIIADHAMIGSKQIPAELPGLIDEYLDGGGVGFPEPASLEDILPATNPPEDTLCEPETPCPGESTRSDATSTPGPLIQVEGDVPPGKPSAVQGVSNGFSLAILFIAGILASLVYSGFVFLRGMNKQTSRAGKKKRPDDQATEKALMERRAP